MARAPDPRIEQAKAMYLEGRKLIDIAKDLDLPEGTVRRWKSTHKWDSERSDKNSERSVKKKEYIKKGDKLLEDRLSETPELPEKQQLFCILYAKTLNAAQSYKKAYGCSYEAAVAAASRLLTNVKVREEVKRLKKERFEAQLFDEHDIFQRYLDIATSSLTDYVDFGREEVPVISMTGLVTKKDPETGEDVPVTKEVNFVKFRDSSEVDGRMIRKVKMGKDGASIELYDAMKAMEWLAEHMSMGTAGQQGLAQSIIAAHRSRELLAEKEDQEGDDKKEDKEGRRLMDSLGEAIRFYAKDPVYFVEDIIRARPDEKQRDILKSLRDYPMTSVRSGHGIGKSAVEAWAVIWFLMTRPFPKIPCTAPTKHQLYDVLWAEVSKWLRNNPELKKELIWTYERIYMRGYKEEWFAVPRTATNPDALQGFHSEHVLYIIDEASGVPDKVFEPVLGAMTGEDAKLLMMGNPTRLTGFFYDSHHGKREQYSAMHVDGRDSSHVAKKFVQDIIRMFGEDSDVFRVRVAGQFPKSAPDSLIAMEWCEEAARREPEISRDRIDIGIDVARYGDDSSALYPLLDKAESLGYELYHHNRTTEISGYAVIMIKRLAADYPEVAVMRVKVDCDGLGVGVYDNLYEQKDRIIEEIWLDRLRRQGLDPENPEQYQECVEVPRIDLEIVECHFGGAGGKVEEGDPVEYSNSTGLMWGKVRKYLQEGRLRLPDDDTLFSQLSNRKYIVGKDGRLELERKEAMKKRGVSSPDIADALALALYDPNNEWTLEW